MFIEEFVVSFLVGACKTFQLRFEFLDTQARTSIWLPKMIFEVEILAFYPLGTCRRKMYFVFYVVYLLYSTVPFWYSGTDKLEVLSI